jgi:hypothetical protein
MRTPLRRLGQRLQIQIIQRRILALILFLAVCAVGCSQNPKSTPTQTLFLLEKPVTNPLNEAKIEPGEIIPVRVVNVREAVEYRWKLQGDGKISSTKGDAILYTAPAEKEGGIAIVTVTAHSAQGASAPTSPIIYIQPVATVRLDALAKPLGRISKVLIERASGLNDCDTGTDCLRFTYRPGEGQGGVYWWPLCIGQIVDIRCQETGEQGNDDKDPLCIAFIKTQTWDEIQKGVCGINVLEAGHLSTVKRLTFLARGAQGEEIVTFNVGAVGMPPDPPRSTAGVTLAPTWEPYKIDLEGTDLTNAIILFSWDATDVNNPEGAIFYLDDVQFEGTR